MWAANDDLFLSTTGGNWTSRHPRKLHSSSFSAPLRTRLCQGLSIRDTCFFSHYPAVTTLKVGLRNNNYRLKWRKQWCSTKTLNCLYCREVLGKKVWKEKAEMWYVIGSLAVLPIYMFSCSRTQIDSHVTMALTLLFALISGPRRNWCNGIPWNTGQQTWISSHFSEALSSIHMLPAVNAVFECCSRVNLAQMADLDQGYVCVKDFIVIVSSNMNKMSFYNLMDENSGSGGFWWHRTKRQRWI